MILIKKLRYTIPNDKRYHVEVRTDFYHSKQYVDLLFKLGIGYVLSHWTWLPPLRKQFIGDTAVLLVKWEGENKSL